MKLFEHLIERENFDIVAEKDYTVEKWFYGPRFNGYIIKVTISFIWKDQGYGNRVGKIWLQIVRDKEMILQTRRDLCGIAPHDWDKVNIYLTRGDAIVSNFRPSEHFRFIQNVGGVGGHCLHVRGFRSLVKLQGYS